MMLVGQSGSVLTGLLPVQVRLDGQVGSAHRLHQPLPQIVLVLQNLLEMGAEHLHHLEPPSCTTHASALPNHTMGHECEATLTEVEPVCDISALLLHLQELHLQLQLQQEGQGLR